MPSRARPTVDELISTLQRSQLPTVIIEGDDDVIVYRRLEEAFDGLGLSILPAGGRNAVLAIFIRRAELGSTRIAFAADRDAWVIRDVPDPYVNEKLVLTNGYSIENDVFRDGNLESLLTDNERAQYREALDRFIEWYALAFTRDNHGLHPREILDHPTRTADMMQLEPSEAYPADLRQRIQADYMRLLRGKSLLAILVQHLSYPGRVPKHNAAALLEREAVRPGALVQELFERIRASLGS